MLQLVPLQGAAGGIFLIVALIGLAITALWIWVSYWVYNDAAEREMDSGLLWAIVTFVGGVLGLVVYLLVREDKPRSAAY